METVAYSSRSAAQACAARWLDELIRPGGLGWEWDTPTTLICEPVTDFPCRVLATAAPIADGFVPHFAFTAGVKYESRYWQGHTTDEEDRPLAPPEAINALQVILEVIVRAYRVPLP